MKTEKMLDAIGDISDRYIEEFAYGKTRFSKAPWGMIATAACFCLVIGVAVFLHNAGLIPYLPGFTEGTEPTVSTDPSKATQPSETSRPQVTREELDAVRDLFKDRDGWYNRALVDQYFSPDELHLRYYFHNSAEFGEGLEPTREEMDALMAWEDYQSGKELVILPVSKMDAILTEYFDITVAEMHSTAFAGLRYVESIDSWCFWGGPILNSPQISIQDIEKDTDDSFRLSYTIGAESYEVRVTTHGSSYRILYNILIEESKDPEETTAPTVPDEARPGIEELFCERGTWYNIVLADTFTTPQEISLESLFSRTYDGEAVVLTEYEKEALKGLLESAGAGKITRYTAQQIDEVLLICFNKTAAELGLNLDSHFTYLKETDCYYGLYWGTPGNRIENVRTEPCNDGTVNLYFSWGADRIVKLQPHDTGYYILSNEYYVDNTGKTEDQIAMEALFRDYQSWYNRAVACEYASPSKLSLHKFFYNGFDDEPRAPTNQEWEQLKDNPHFDINYDLFRLPVDKMNAVLTEYFGITLDDVEPEGFDGLVYLESTNCYYCMHTGWLGVEDFQTLSVDWTDDGTVLVRYQGAYMEGEYVVSMKRHNEGYRILSNLPG